MRWPLFVRLNHCAVSVVVNVFVKRNRAVRVGPSVATASCSESVPAAEHRSAETDRRLFLACSTASRWRQVTATGEPLSPLFLTPLLLDEGGLLRVLRGQGYAGWIPTAPSPQIFLKGPAYRSTSDQPFFRTCVESGSAAVSLARAAAESFDSPMRSC